MVCHGLPISKINRVVACTQLHTVYINNEYKLTTSNTDYKNI